MLKFYSFFIFLLVFAKLDHSSFAQELIKEVSGETFLNKPVTCFNCPQGIESIHFPEIPIMKNTGNPERDALVYKEEKEKWIEMVLAMFKNKFTAEQKNKIREKIRDENLEEVLKGKVLFVE